MALVATLTDLPFHTSSTALRTVLARAVGQSGASFEGVGWQQQQQLDDDEPDFTKRNYLFLLLLIPCCTEGVLVYI